MSQRLNGKNPLSYLGVNPVTPPGFLVNENPPTTVDSKNFLLGQIWLQRNTQNLWMLTSLVGGIATWTPFAGGGVIVETLTGNTGGAVPPTADNINVIGDGTTIEVAGNPGTSTLTISAVGSGLVQTLRGDDFIFVGPTAGNIDILATPTAGATVSFDAVALSTLGLKVTDASDNTIIGNGSGNLTLTGASSTGLGKSVLPALTTGNNNVAIGDHSMFSALATTETVAIGSSSGRSLINGGQNTFVGHASGTGALNASRCVAIGFQALDSIVSATDTIAIGNLSGSAYSANESSNIIIGNIGVASENNTIRIGTQGAGAGEQNAVYMAGVYQAAVGGTNEFVIVDNTGKLGSTSESPFANEYVTDSGTAIPAAGILNVVGGVGITTSGAGNTVTITNTGGGAGGSLTFGAYLGTSQNLSAGGTPDTIGSATALTNVYDNSGGAWYPGNGAGTPASFTAPATGVYIFTVGYYLSNAQADNNTATAFLVVNGSLNQNTFQVNLYAVAATPIPVLNNAYRVRGTHQVRLTAGDVVTFLITLTGSAGAQMFNGGAAPTTGTTFSGYRLT